MCYLPGVVETSKERNLISGSGCLSPHRVIGMTLSWTQGRWLRDLKHSQGDRSSVSTSLGGRLPALSVCFILVVSAISANLDPSWNKARLFFLLEYCLLPYLTGSSCCSGNSTLSSMDRYILKVSMLPLHSLETSSFWTLHPWELLGPTHVSFLFIKCLWTYFSLGKGSRWYFPQLNQRKPHQRQST